MIKKLYILQTLSMLGLLLCDIYFNVIFFYRMSSVMASDIFFRQAFIELITIAILITVIYLSSKKKIYSAIIIALYSAYVLIKFGNILELPSIIFNAFLNGNFQFGLNLSFICINLVLSIAIFCIWLSKISFKNGK